MVERQVVRARAGWAMGLLLGAGLLCLPAVARLRGAAGGDAGQQGQPPAVTLAPGDVQGTVTGTGGAPLPAGLEVALLDPQSGRELVRASTGADGSYVLVDVPPGAYVLHVGAPGIEAAVRVTEGAQAGTLDVLMPAVLVAPAPAGEAAGPVPAPAPAMAAEGEESLTLVAAPLLTEAEQGSAVVALGNGPPSGNPGNPKPPRPPGRPPDKPLPPPFISPTSP